MTGRRDSSRATGSFERGRQCCLDESVVPKRSFCYGKLLFARRAPEILVLKRCDDKASGTCSRNNVLAETQASGKIDAG
jgi:hypothetical protein